MTQKAIKFITCGHVDDGKSTLLGRLLFEMDVLPQDQIAAATENGILDYSRLTDGLEDERAQGITIDVAYRYVRHNNRHYRFADTPGHVQYLRNMAVAAPDGDAALLLIDAAYGVREQTLRHAKIAAYFGITDFVLAINKMDKVAYDQAVYDAIVAEFHKHMADFADLHITAIPLSALDGENVANKSSFTPWYAGPSLYDYISHFTPRPKVGMAAALAVQNIVRITPEVRGYQGVLRGGPLKIGDDLFTPEAHQTLRVTDIYHSGHHVEAALQESSIMICVDCDVDLARGTVLHARASRIDYADFMEGGLVILDNRFHNQAEMSALLKCGHQEVSAQVKILQQDGPISYAEIYTAKNTSYAPFSVIPELGLFILIEQGSEKVIAVGRFGEKSESKDYLYAI
ncbi:MAG: GTP-binding protein [Pseudomonadota bacterium]